MAHFRKRKTWALVTSIVSNVIAIILIALGGALALGSMTGFPGEYLANRYAPGKTGTITLPSDGEYAITRAKEAAPTCSVATADGTPVEVTTRAFPEANGQSLQVFSASSGGHVVTCDGGQQGVVVFAVKDLGLVTNGWLSLLLTSLPFVAAGVGVFLLGKALPKRIAPESMRPLIPS